MRAPTNGTENITIINSTDFISNERPKMSLQVPPELVNMFRGSDYTNEDEEVRLASFLYFDIQRLFPLREMFVKYVSA